MTAHIPTLRTQRLVLLPLSAACTALYENFYTDAEASRFYGGPLTSAAAQTRLAADLGSWQLQGFGVWALQRRDPGDFVGVCGFWQGLGWPRELTWWLLPAARGAGLAHEASLAAVAHAYDVFAWPAVETYMNDENKAARALVHRLGGMHLDRRMFPDGAERDVFRIPSPSRQANSPQRDSGLQPKGIAWVGLFAMNQPALVRFYRDVVGLRVLEGDDDCCIFDAGGGALFEVWGRGTASVSRKSPQEQSMLVGFLVDDLDTAVAALQAKGLAADSKIDSYLGTRWVYYTDPEGNRFELKDAKG
jgi:[ribosomal protein S5]-alanine N-acetyltransferase